MKYSAIGNQKHQLDLTLRWYEASLKEGVCICFPKGSGQRVFVDGRGLVEGDFTLVRGLGRWDGLYRVGVEGDWNFIDVESGDVVETKTGRGTAVRYLVLSNAKDQERSAPHIVTFAPILEDPRPGGR